MILHPDKPGQESTAAFQELKNSYDKVCAHFEEKGDIPDPSDDQEVFFRDNFENFNFPYENKGSFTVLIQDALADTWQECLQILLGAKDQNQGDRIWEVMHGDEKKIEITIYIYNKNKNKKGSN